METPLAHPQRGEAELASNDPVTIEAEDLFITSPEGKTLVGFTSILLCQQANVRC